MIEGKQEVHHLISVAHPSLHHAVTDISTTNHRHIYRIDAQHLKPYFEKYVLELYQKRRHVHTHSQQGPGDHAVHINKTEEVDYIKLAEQAAEDEYKEVIDNTSASKSFIKDAKEQSNSKIAKETNHMLNVSLTPGSYSIGIILFAVCPLGYCR